MSYTSESFLPESTKLRKLEELIELLGYKTADDSLRIPDRVRSYYWYEYQDYHSYVGVGLSIYVSKHGAVKVATRSRSGRSYWDLIQQNKTLKLIRDYFGGYFITDAGRNRYWRPDEKPEPPLAAGCFLARWTFHNNLIRAQVYLMNREIKGPIAIDKSSGFDFLDEMNPRVLSNNLLVPYLVAVWEDYFRSTFVAVLKYGSRGTALKRVRLSHHSLERVTVGRLSIEQAIADTFSFQRPSSVADNFRLLDPKLDVGAILRKPYRRRKTTLFNSIETLVEDRNLFVHTGRMNLELFDQSLKTTLTDIEAAGNRVYEYIAKHYGFTPSHDY